MATIPTQIRIDKETREEAAILLDGLGMSLSEAINIFLKQVVLRGGMPFEVTYPQYKSDVISAIREAKQISHDPSVKAFTDVSSMFEEILNKNDED